MHVRSSLEAVVGRGGVRSALASGELVRFGQRVLVARDRMLDFPTRCAAALLWAGSEAVLARETALRLFGCTAAGVGSVHLLVPYSVTLNPRPGVSVHHGRVGDVRSVDGLRCQALDAALCDVLCRGDRHVALACADEALGRMPMATRAELKAELSGQINRRSDTRGVRRGRELLGLATGVPPSPQRSRLLLTLVDAGLPVPAQGYEVRSGVDDEEPVHYAWPAARLALHYGSARCLPGWTVLRADDADLRNPTRLITRLKRALRSGADAPARAGA
ncbi:hypothetical protein ACQPZF_37855 [Actinosynnema sp. CS-041913]|uniref:hypothetical protein n=1 Tax=Actinosynnema sp. CS-041913 TaxID=3239917 RepID=UPI003D92A540